MPLRLHNLSDSGTVYSYYKWINNCILNFVGDVLDNLTLLLSATFGRLFECRTATGRHWRRQRT